MSQDFHGRLAGGTKASHALIVAVMALFTDMLLVSLAIPVLPLLPAVVESGSAWTGVLFASYSLSMVIATIFAGYMVDRSGPKTPLLVGLIGMGASTLLFAVGQPFWLLMVARLAQGFSGGITWVAAFALIAATTPIEKRGQSMGMALGITSVAFLIGPPLAGVMVNAWGTASPFLLAAGIAVIDGILRLWLVKDVAVSDDDMGGPLTVLRVPGSWSIVALVVFGAALPAAIEPILPLHLKVDELTVGLLYSVAAVISMVVNPFAGSLITKVPSRTLAAIGVVVGVSALILMAQAITPMIAAIALGLMAIGGSFAFTPANTLISEQGIKSQPPTLGGTFALSNLAYGAGMTIGPLLSGFGAQERGYATALLITAVVLVVIGLAGLPRLPHLGPNTVREAQA